MNYTDFSPKISIFYQFKFSYSYCGYSYATLFKEIQTEDIQAVEKFVREDLYDILSSKADSNNGDSEILLPPNDLIEHFGVLFASNPSKFRFLPGDLKYIQLVKDHVANEITNKGKKQALLRFYGGMKQKKNRKKIKPGVSRDSLNENCPDKRNVPVKIEYTEKNDCTDEKCDIKTRLFQCIKDKMTKFGIPEEILSVFTESFVDVNQSDKDNITGDITCIVCYVKSETPEKVKPKRVYYRNISATSQSWVISNFTSHLHRHRNIIDSLIKNEYSEELVEVIGDESADFKTNESDQCEISVNLSIESVDLLCDQTTKIEKSLNEQMLAQSIKMWQKATMNCEQMTKMRCISTEGVIIAVDVVATAKNGDCLFSAIAHQLFGNAIDSKEHNKATSELRTSVSKYIRDHYDDFIFELRGHVYELQEIDGGKSYGLDKFTNIDDACRHLVTNFLPKQSFWGGGETLKAITYIHKVKIFICIQ